MNTFSVILPIVAVSDPNSNKEWRDICLNFLKSEFPAGYKVRGIEEAGKVEPDPFKSIYGRPYGAIQCAKLTIESAFRRKYVVTGVDRSSRRFKIETYDRLYALSINLWSGSVWEKTDRKRLIKRV